MSRRILLALAALGAVVGAYFALQGRKAGDERAGRREARLLQFDDRLVSAFTLAERGSIWRFERHASAWRLTVPVPDAVSSASVEQLFAAARRAPVTRTIQPYEALAAYGLDPARVVLKLEGVPAPALHVGEADPTGEGVFARVEGREGVLVVRLPEAGILQFVTANRLRDPSPIGAMRSDVEGLILTDPEGSTHVRKEADGWWIVAPRRLPASDAAVERLIAALEKLSIQALDDGADRTDPALGLGAMARRIAIETHAATRTLTIGAALDGGTRAATRDDRATLMRIDAGALEGLPFDARGLADTRLTKLNRFAVTRLAWAGAAGAVTAAREGETTWKAPDGALLRSDVIVAFLARALEAPVASWDAAPPRGRPAAVLDLTLDGGRAERLEYWDDGRGRLASIPDATARLTGPVPALTF